MGGKQTQYNILTTMADFINETSHIARKEHRCLFCGDVIKVGERYKAWTSAEGGKINTDKYNENCAYAIQQFCDGEEYYITSEIMDSLNEELKEKGITPAKTVHEAVNQWCESIKIV